MMEPLTLNSDCPGGRNKKIKFCCPEILKELNQLLVMLEGKQYAAAESLLNTLEPSHPDCACLAFARCDVLRGQERFDEALSLAQSWVEKEPHNTRALNELVRLYLILERPFDALNSLIDSIESVEEGTLDMEQIEFLFALAQFMLYAKLPYITYSILRVLENFRLQDNRLSELFSQWAGNKQLRSLYKMITPEMTYAEQFPEREKRAEALNNFYIGHWKKSLRLLEELRPLADSWGFLYRDLAMVRFHLGMMDEASADLKKYIAAASTDPDDAIEAMEFNWFYEGTFLNDEIPIHDRVTWSLTDGDKALEKLLSEPHFVASPMELPELFGQSEGPRPKQYFKVLDRPLVRGSSEEFTRETIPRLRSFLAFYGKQTDRPARIELLQIESLEQDPVVEILKNGLGDLLGPIENEGTLIQDSWTRIHMTPLFYWQAFAIQDPERDQRIYHEYLENEFCEQWLAHPLGVLDGKTPAEAMKDPSMGIALQATLERFRDSLSLEENLQDAFIGFIRRKLGLQEDRTIAVDTADKIKSTFELANRLPIWRWNRLDLAVLPVEHLLALFQATLVFEEREVMAKIATLIFDLHDAEVKEQEVRDACFRALIMQSLANGNEKDANEWLHKAYEEATRAGGSDGQWHLLELSMQYRMGRLERVRELSEHILKLHANEKEVIGGLYAFMQSLGIGMGKGAAPQQAQAPVQEAPKSGLWTPDNENEQGTTGSKLWIPGE